MLMFRNVVFVFLGRLVFLATHIFLLLNHIYSSNCPWLRKRMYIYLLLFPFLLKFHYLLILVSIIVSQLCFSQTHRLLWFSSNNLFLQEVSSSATSTSYLHHRINGNRWREELLPPLTPSAVKPLNRPSTHQLHI